MQGEMASMTGRLCSPNIVVLLKSIVKQLTDSQKEWV